MHGEVQEVEQAAERLGKRRRGASVAPTTALAKDGLHAAARERGARGEHTLLAVADHHRRERAQRHAMRAEHAAG